uniref:Uncharacterized protein n=1 Tax=Rhizophora mucronata TaxID=61149 RepID=A0A2P2MXG0_RHIMU
MQIYVYIYI